MTEATEIVLGTTQAVAMPDVGHLMELALEKGGEGVEVLERLVGLQERMIERQAEAAMNQALARFKATVPPIRKTASADIVTKSGGRFGYTYAPLSEIARVTQPILEKCGLSYTWDSESQGGTISAVCILRHVDGAERRATFTGPTGSNSGASEIQKVGAALTYARRQSLVQVLGLTTADDDTDGAERVDATPITEAQLADLQALYDEVKAKVNEVKFLKYFGIASLSEMPASSYPEAVRLLEGKRS